MVHLRDRRVLGRALLGPARRQVDLLIPPQQLRDRPERVRAFEQRGQFRKGRVGRHARQLGAARGGEASALSPLHHHRSAPTPFHHAARGAALGGPLSAARRVTPGRS